jgi:hypothetical protein
MKPAHEDVSFDYKVEAEAYVLNCPDHHGIPGVLNNMEFYDTIRQADAVDVLTYTFVPWAATNYKRVIYVIGDFPSSSSMLTCKVTKSHTKLYIAKFNTITRAYIGSMNVGYPTLYELMVELDKTQTVFAKKHFNELWKLNYKPKCPKTK